MLIQEHRQQLSRLAETTALRAYAPYSRFRVGAVAVGKRGNYTGANVENASYGLSLCAERVALAAAVAAGDTEISVLVVACIDALPGQSHRALLPCGACRQWIAELAPKATIVIAQLDVEYSIEQLLPAAFRL